MRLDTYYRNNQLQKWKAFFLDASFHLSDHSNATMQEWLNWTEL